MLCAAAICSRLVFWRTQYVSCINYSMGSPFFKYIGKKPHIGVKESMQADCHCMLPSSMAEHTGATAKAGIGAVFCCLFVAEGSPLPATPGMHVSCYCQMLLSQQVRCA